MNDKDCKQLRNDEILSHHSFPTEEKEEADNMVPCSEPGIHSLDNKAYTGSPNSDASSNSDELVEKDDEDDCPVVNKTSEKETRNVLHLKIIVLLILLVSAIVGAVSVYIYITRSETSQFESQFHFDASKVLEAVESSLERTLGAMETVAITLVSYANDKNDSWPFVTLPNFPTRVSKLLPITSGFVISILPILYPEKRKEWEKYSLAHDQWMNESMAIQEVWDGYYGEVGDFKRHGTIFGLDGDIEGNVR
jgi:hypothetical protein